jgi:hypothetical protein
LVAHPISRAIRCITRRTRFRKSNARCLPTGYTRRTDRDDGAGAFAAVVAVGLVGIFAFTVPVMFATRTPRRRDIPFHWNALVKLRHVSTDAFPVTAN